MLIMFFYLVMLSTGFAVFKIYNHIEDILKKLNLKFEEAINIGCKYLHGDE